MLIPVLLTLALGAADGGPAPRDAGRRDGGGKLKVAVLTLTAGVGVDPKLCDVVTDSLVAALQARTELQIISSREIQMALGFERQKVLAGCGDQQSCVVEIGGALGVDHVVSGSLAKVGDSLIFSAQEMDIARALVEHRHQRRMKGATEEAFLDDVRLVVADLFPAPDAGSPPPASSVAAPAPDAGLAPAGAAVPVAASTSAHPPPAAGLTLLPNPGGIPAGTARREPRSGLELVYHPPAIYLMGCVEGDAECEGKGEKSHRVQVSGFWMGRTETTALAYSECVAAGACPDIKERDATSPLCTVKNKQPKHPANCVTYDEAKAFCAWIGGRLPTAEEWEYAAKGGEARRFPWGNEPLDARRANFCDVNCPKVLPPRELKIPGRYDSTQDDHYVATSPVKAFPDGKSRWGLFDMAGNVREWTSNDVNARNKDVRGGSWSAREVRLRTSARYGVPPGKWETDVGFRCVLEK